MANEAVILEKYGYPPGEPRQVTVAAGTAVSKGALMVLTSDPQTASASSTVNQFFVGIASDDKDAEDPSTRLAVYTNVLADLVTVATGNLPAFGDPVQISGANLIRAFLPTSTSYAALLSFAQGFLGIAQETATGSERIAVRIRV